MPDLGKEPLKIGCGLALDLGTASVGAYLYDLAEGNCLAAAWVPNQQALFGKTIEERIAFAAEDKNMLRETAVIREQVFDLILELTAQASKKTGTSLSFADVHYVSIAGNTVMQHLYAATSPRSIGEAGHKPLTLFGEQILAEPTMYFCPCLSGFVGGDLVASVYGSGACSAKETTLLIDLGERIGLALGNENGFLCADVPASEAAKTVEQMLNVRKISAADVKEVLIAGSAGMDPETEKKTAEALLCAGLLEKSRNVGNATGTGAALALSQRGRDELKQLASKCNLL